MEIFYNGEKLPKDVYVVGVDLASDMVSDNDYNWNTALVHAGGL